MSDLLRASAYEWNPFAVPWMVLGVVLLALSAVIFARQRASRVALLFCAMIMLAAIWFLAFATMYLARDAGDAEAWARVALSAVCILPAAIYDFTVTALRLHSARRKIVAALWVVGGAFSVACLLTPMIIGGVAMHPWGFYPTAGTTMPLFLVFFFGALVGQLVDGAIEWRKTTDAVRRRRIAKLMVSFAIVYFGALDFIPMFGLSMWPSAYIPVLAFMVAAWGSIWHHRLVPISAARASREILQTMADALFVIDDAGHMRVINDAVTSILGYSEADLIGRSIDRLEVVAGDATISRTLRAVSTRGVIRDQEWLLRHKDGRSVSVSVSVSPVSERDVQEGAVVIARDITERKRAEEALHEALLRLEHSNRELEDFAYVASHDLQEPLRKIQAFGDLLKAKHGDALPPQGRDYVDRMKSAAGRMQVLINDLLSFSRVTTRAHPFEPVDLGLIAREVARDLEIRTHETGGHIEIEQLPTIDADPLQMRQLLQNLAGNGLKFRRSGVPPVVRIAGSTEKDRCILTVSDNGVGFEQKYAERIFTIFERLHGRGEYEGTGIGLAICRKIAERHGGEITAQSTPGEGSTFTVTLPLRHVQEREWNHA